MSAREVNRSKMEWGRAWATLALASLLAAGCGTSRMITTRTGLRHNEEKTITVYAEKDEVYTLRRHALEDTVITGSGTVRRGDTKAVFHGSIPLTSIRAVRTNSKDFVKGLVVVGLTALFAAELTEGDRHPGGLRVTEEKPLIYPSSGGGGGGSSCPYVYSWDGNRYVLDAEPFGAALGKGLELTTVHRLPSARAEKGVVRLRLTNERRETHYVNSLSVFAIELGDALDAALDEEGTAWPLTRPEAPVRAADASGANILPAIASADGRLWECDASRLLPESGYEDVVEVEFLAPARADRGTLILTGINTTLSAAIYGQLDHAVDDPVTLAHAIDHDPEMIERLREFRDDASLLVSVWNGSAWERAGAFLPEANAVPFTRALRLDVPRGAGDTVRVRLRAMADVWKIDAVATDWTPASPLRTERLSLVSAVAADGEDLSAPLRADDADYAILVPPDRVDLTFADVPRHPGERVAYAVAGRGYLHEWSSVPEVAAGSWTSGDTRLAWIKQVMKQREIALRPAYEEWRYRRAEGR